MKSTRDHQAQVLQPLVVTPSPLKGESLPAFILRTAELNGYESPMKLLHYAGMDDNEARSARPSLEKLAPLFGKTAKELKATGLDNMSQFKGRYVQIMGHSIPSMFTSCKHASVCLECVKEHGYIDGFHELKYALVCPKHQVKTVNSCFACHKPLSWHRVGLTKCSCGAELIQSASEKVTDSSVLALLGVLYAKLMKQPFNQAQMDGCGFPKEAMEQLSIQTLLSVIYRFGLFNDSSKDTNTDFLAVKTTAEVFTDWPHKFHDYLEEIHAPGANLKVSGLRAQFNSFYESFFKNIASDQELQFMRDAFVKFGQQRWRHAGIHPKLLSEHSTTKALIYGMGVYEFSEKIGVQPVTARKLIAKGLVQVTMSELNQTRKLIELSPQQQFEFAEGKSLSIKKAARILDLPVAILRVYRAKGYYQAKYLAIPIELFHERDVESLHKDLMQGCEPCRVFVNDRHITMAQVMRMKMNADVKAVFIADVKNRAITPLGTSSEKPSGLVFDRFTTKRHLDQTKQRLAGGVSFEVAKDTLQVNRRGLLGLIHAEALQYQYKNTEMTIIEGSLQLFDDRYISVKDVAKLKSITSSSLINLCSLLGIHLFKAQQADFFKAEIIWIERCKLFLLGVSDHFVSVNFEKAA